MHVGGAGGKGGEAHSEISPAEPLYRPNKPKHAVLPQCMRMGVARCVCVRARARNRRMQKHARACMRTRPDIIPAFAIASAARGPHAGARGEGRRTCARTAVWWAAATAGAAPRAEPRTAPARTETRESEPGTRGSRDVHTRLSAHRVCMARRPRVCDKGTRVLHCKCHKGPSLFNPPILGFCILLWVPLHSESIFKNAGDDRGTRLVNSTLFKSTHFL